MVSVSVPVAVMAIAAKALAVLALLFLTVMLSPSVVAPTTEQNTLAGNPKTVNLSLDKYNEEFNKKEFIPINEGLLQTINWQKSLYYE